MWRELKVNGTPPSKRLTHSAVVWYADTSRCRGGYGRLTDAKSSVSPSLSLFCVYVCVVRNGCMFVFGGWDGHNFLNDLHEFNLATHTWRQVTAYGKPPAKRNAFRYGWSTLFNSFPRCAIGDRVCL